MDWVSQSDRAGRGYRDEETTDDCDIMIETQSVQVFEAASSWNRVFRYRGHHAAILDAM